MTDLPIPHRQTPLIESAALSRAAGCRIFLKLDNLQPAGSFKSRGVGNFIRRQLAERRQQHGSKDDSSSSSSSSSGVHYYISSGGNAGLAAVTAARTLGQRCTVVVPVSTKPSMVAKLRAVGATDVVQTGASWREADAYLRETFIDGGENPQQEEKKKKKKKKEEEEAVYVPPFDHEYVFEGNASLVTELAEAMPPGGNEEPDAIVCSVGGGGLFAGIAQGVSAVYGDRVKIVAAETLGCDSLSQSLAAGELVTLPRISSLATSLGAVRVAATAFERAACQPNVSSVVVTDADAAMGCWRFADDERTLVELACGASVCLAYNGMLKDVLPGLTPDSKVVIVVCGGANISLQLLADYREIFGVDAEEKKKATDDATVPSTHTAPS